MIPIKIVGTKILLAKKYLGLDEAQIWIGPDEEGPTDDDDEKVLLRRKKAEENYKLGRTKRPSGISIFSIKDDDSDGYYELETSDWKSGLYRFNYHGKANEKSLHGSKLNLAKRDLEYSWAVFSDEIINYSEVKPFVYDEPNGRGFCFRVKIEDNKIEPAGNRK